MARIRRFSLTIIGKGYDRLIPIRTGVLEYKKEAIIPVESSYLIQKKTKKKGGSEEESAFNQPKYLCKNKYLNSFYPFSLLALARCLPFPTSLNLSLNSSLGGSFIYIYIYSTHIVT